MGGAESNSYDELQHLMQEGVNQITYTRDLRHVTPNKLLTPEETLNTSDINQKRFTTPRMVSDDSVFSLV